MQPKLSMQTILEWGISGPYCGCLFVGATNKNLFKHLNYIQR